MERGFVGVDAVNAKQKEHLAKLAVLAQKWHREPLRE